MKIAIATTGFVGLTNFILPAGWVISKFIVQALLVEELTIYGEGEQSRSFS